ncbi:MAG: ATP-binding protein, partial [Cyanobacteria bacterium J06560_2]
MSQGTTTLSTNGGGADRSAADRMTYEQPTAHEHIVLSARLGANADVLSEVLAAEAEVQIEEPTVETVARAIAQEASLIVLTEEVLIDAAKTAQLGNYLSHQPTWSDIPVIILLSECKRFDDCLALLGQTTHHRSVLLLELPLQRMTFSTIVRACLQNRRRQYTLRDTLSQLQESNQALQNYSYTAAHELRNPLGIAKTSFDLLARTSLTTSQQKFVDMGQRTTHRMNQLIGALLNYSKVQSTGDEFTAVDMTAVVQEATDGLQALIQERQADISWATLPTVQGNRQLLTQLISNLVKNAIVHNTSDSPRVAIAAQTTEDFKPGNINAIKRDLPESLAAAETNRWVFCVTDNGPGISPEIQTQIFQMFNRAGKSRAEGSGIGLALCQRVAQQHQTTIGVASKLGDGSTFYFDLAA